MHVLITGGAGFIGSNLTDHFLAQGHQVRVLDNFLTGRRTNIAHLADEPRFELVEGDLRDPDAVAAACQGIEVILHEGAIPSVPRSVDEPADSHQANIDGTFNLLLAARDAGVRRVVYAASSSAYGDVDAPVKTETIRPQPKSPYAIQKLVGEYYMTVFASQWGLETVSLRYFNVFGPRQDPTSQYSAVIPAFMTRMLRGERPVIYGDGEQSRDFTFIANVAAANHLAATAEGVDGQVVNIACGQAVTLLEIVAILNRMIGTNLEPMHEPERAGDVKHSLADITAARNLLGYEPTVSFEEGLEQTLAHYREIVAQS